MPEWAECLRVGKLFCECLWQVQSNNKETAVHMIRKRKGKKGINSEPWPFVSSERGWKASLTSLIKCRITTAEHRLGMEWGCGASVQVWGGLLSQPSCMLLNIKPFPHAIYIHLKTGLGPNAPRLESPQYCGQWKSFQNYYFFRALLFCGFVGLGFAPLLVFFWLVAIKHKCKMSLSQNQIFACNIRHWPYLGRKQTAS